MNKTCLKFAATILFAGTTCFGTAQDTEAAKAADAVVEGIAGKQAPELVVENWVQLPSGKKTLSIKDYEGKVLIMLFFQHTSVGCDDVAFPRLKELSDHYKSNDKVQFIAIQTAFNNLLENTPDKLEPKAKRFGLSFPFGHYTYTASYPGMGGLRGTYKSPHVPWFVVVGSDGAVKYNGTQIDVNMSIKNIDELVK